MKAYVGIAGTESAPGQTSGWMGISAVVASLLCILLPVAWLVNEYPLHSESYRQADVGGYVYSRSHWQPYADSLKASVLGSIALGVAGVVLAWVFTWKSDPTGGRRARWLLLAGCVVAVMCGMLLDFWDYFAFLIVGGLHF